MTRRIDSPSARVNVKETLNRLLFPSAFLAGMVFSNVYGPYHSIGENGPNEDIVPEQTEVDYLIQAIECEVVSTLESDKYKPVLGNTEGSASRPEDWICAGTAEEVAKCILDDSLEW